MPEEEPLGQQEPLTAASEGLGGGVRMERSAP